MKNQNTSRFSLITYFKASGPGWLQAAVTLGGGTLVSALYLGVIGGYEFLWLQPLAMMCGVIMLYALSYITLINADEPDRRPFQLVRDYISPTLAWGWLLASVLANVVFCASQFALGTDAIQSNLGFDEINPFVITLILGAVAFGCIYLYQKGGKVSALIQNIIKVLVALIVLAFMSVAALLISNGQVSGGDILSGLIPDWNMLFRASDKYLEYTQLTGSYSSYWQDYIADNQRNIIIGAFGAAVGINMTFLLPYTLFKKKWNRSHIGFSKFDLIMGLMVPFIIGASCLIIATASQFHAKENSIISEQAYHQVLDQRLAHEYEGYKAFSTDRKEELRAQSSAADQRLSTMLAKRSAYELAESLSPLLGRYSQLIFGIGILAMALSTMLIHMMINGYAVREALGLTTGDKWFLIGAAMPAVSGILSPIIWSGSIKAAIVIPASVIATTLLPLAYLAFLLMMNSSKVLKGNFNQHRTILNVFMIITLAISYFAAIWALTGKMGSNNSYEKILALVGLLVLGVFSILGIIGYFRNNSSSS